MNPANTKSGARPGADVPPVMILGDHFGYSSGVAHGGTIYFLNVLPALSAAGVDVTALFLRHPHPAAAALRGSGAEPIFLSAHPIDPLVIFRVAKIAKQRGCRIIHAGGIKATLVARIVAPMVGAEAVVHVHDLTFPSRAVSTLHRVFARPTDTGLCVSQAVRDVVIRGYHVRPEQCRVVYNGIPLDSMRRATPESRAALRAEWQVRDDANVITMVARMHPVKGHIGMLQMLAGIVRSCPNTVLVLVGDGPDRPACDALVAQLGLQAHVRFLGQRSDIPELLAAADLAVVPSHSEGLGLAAIEALAAGKPVVAYRVGGLGEVVSHDSDGMLIDSGDQEAFAQAVVTLLRDPERRAAFGRNAMLGAERFSLERHIEALLGVYREIGARAAAAK